MHCNLGVIVTSELTEKEKYREVDMAGCKRSVDATKEYDINDFIGGKSTKYKYL